jgi:hypothetical protein
LSGRKARAPGFLPPPPVIHVEFSLMLLNGIMACDGADVVVHAALVGEKSMIRRKLKNGGVLLAVCRKFDLPRQDIPDIIPRVVKFQRLGKRAVRNDLPEILAFVLS